MKEFKIDEENNAICEWKKTRNGFKHEAILLRNGEEIERAKACYLNRTWESYEYQSVLLKLLRKASYSDEQIKIVDDRNQGKEHEKVDKMFGTISMVAAIGEVFCETKKDKNDWKLRMIKAGLENKGLTIPADWDSLSEDEKESRLNKIIELGKV